MTAGLGTGPEAQFDNTEDRPGPVPAPRPPLAHVWVYDGKAYDLSDWVARHPGGAFFIGRTRNRDITSIIGSYHRDPERIARILNRFALDREATPADIHPKNNAPPFLFKADFNSWRDTPKYHFGDDDLLHRVKARLAEPELAARLRRMDTLFDVVVAVLAVGYLAVQGVRLFSPGWMPLPAFVLAMVMLRSSMAAFGHYAIHRAQRGVNRALVSLFDLNYVALALVTADGHSLLHHPHTQSDVDIKKNVFTMMMRLPRLYRIPVHTVHKFGHLCTGMAIRIVDICRITRKVGAGELYGSRRGAAVHFLGSAGVRLLLVGELVAFIVAGDFLAWALQFVATLWVSTFLVVASHDFEEEVPDSAGSDDSEESDEPDDWAINQLQQSHDMTVVGNRYIDCFLSAGLSSHRVHHVLPFQRSGFANIATERVLAEEAARFGVEWLPAKSFAADRLPKLCRTFLLSPSREAQRRHAGFLREHCAPNAWKVSAQYVVGGFVGIGSV